MNNFFEENHKLVFQEWIHPDEAADSTILDLGSQTGWLGEYCMLHNAKDYVGVEIDEFHIIDARSNYPNLTFFHMDLEDYVKNCVTEKKVFDIVVISRTLQGIQNQITLLQNLSKITNKIVLETGVPPNYTANRLLEILKTVSLPVEYREEVEQIKHQIEYNQPFTEYIIDERWPSPVPSTGLLKEILARLGFELCLNTYESVKQKYPSEYGYGIPFNVPDQIMKRSILKFKKVSNLSKPISWKEWDDLKNK
jgi:hypothetical protein